MNPKKVLAAHNYVRPALEDILAGNAVRVATTQPFGCVLAYAGEFWRLGLGAPVETTAPAPALRRHPQ